MKKIIASLIVCGFAVAMVACGGKKIDEAKKLADSLAKVDSLAALVVLQVDSVVTAIDSAATAVK